MKLFDVISLNCDNVSTMKWYFCFSCSYDNT